MGHYPKAVLAYGFDLGYDLDRPERTLAAAAEQPPDADAVLLHLIRWGSDVEPAYLLAAVVHHTDWEQTRVIPDLTVPTGAQEALRRGLEVLGVAEQFADQQPAWRLAAYYPE